MSDEQEPNGVDHYPLDYDALSKGDVIAPETIEAAVNCKRLHPQYALRLLSFKEHLERELMTRGQAITLKCEDQSIRLLTDEEASEYNAKATDAYFRRAAKAHVRNLSVDVGNLTTERRQQHERTLVVNSRMLQAMKRERRTMALESHARVTPGIGNASGE